MMRGKSSYAMAVRRADGGITVVETPLSSASQKYGILKWPLIRGVVALGSSLALGFTSLSQSADIAFEGIEEEEPSRFEKFLFDKFGDKLYDFMKWLAMAIALVIAVGLFFVLPSFIGDLIEGFVFGDEPLPLESVIISTIAGVIRIAIFVGYVFFVSRMKDIQRVFQYHGAEHKAITCHERNLPLTTENVAACPRLHKRCGTSFMLVVMVVSVVVFAALRVLLTIYLNWDMNIVETSISRILLIPLIAGISYEISVKWAGKRNNFLVRAIVLPGMLLQRMTTAEPDDRQIEVAVAALKAAIGPQPEPKRRARMSIPRWKRWLRAK